MAVLSAALLLGLTLAAAPPPVCRGRIAPNYDAAQDQSPTPRAAAEVRAAYDALCPDQDCGSGVLFQNPTVGFNAVTWVSGIRDGAATRAKIVYSAKFLNGLAKRFGDGASFGVLAHEVGHHLTAAKSLRGHFDNSWDEELRADYLAGCALGRTGRGPNEMANALRALASVATPTHPDFSKRVPVVKKGYDDCRAKQDAIDRASSDHGFGIGKTIKRKSRSKGCWSFWYRDEEEVNKIGPVAARRHLSRSYVDRKACELGRRRLLETQRTVADECECQQ